MRNLTAAIDLLRRELHASWLRLLACPGDDFTRTVAAHRDALAVLDTAHEDAVELDQSRAALASIRACIAAARDTSLDVPDEEDISEPIGHDETRETAVDVRGLVVLLRNATHPAANALAGDASTRADLAADVARLERVVADLTRQRDGALGVALHTAGERDRAISELGVVRGENQRLRGQLEAAHRAAGDGVDLAAADVAIEGVLARAGCSLALRGRLRPELLCAVREHLRSEHVESGEAEGVEGGDHRGGESLAPATGCQKSRGGQSS